METHFEIGWGTLWRALLVVVIAAGLFYSLDIIVGVFLAIIISSAVNPFVTWLENKISLPRVIGAVLVFLIIALFLASLIYIVTPLIIEEIHRLLENYFPYIGKVLDIDILKNSDIFTLSFEKILGYISSFTGGNIFEWSQSLFGSLTLFISVLAMAFYLTVDHRGIERFLRAVLPMRYEESAVDIFLRARSKMGYWLQAQILLSFCVGLLVFAGLYVLGVPHAFVLAILAGVLEIIPFVGPVFTAAFAFGVSFAISSQLAIYVLIYFILVQQIENNVLVPLFMKQAVGLHPVAILIALLVGANLFGFIGLILAVPATVVIEEFLDDLERRKSHRQTLM